MIRANIDMAYHEAAHVVAHLYKRCPFVRVSVVPDPEADYLGIVEGKWEARQIDALQWGDERAVNRAEREIFVILAGHAIDIARSCDYSDETWEQDRQGAIDLADSLCGGPEEAGDYLGEVLRQAEDFIKRPQVRARIEAIADALYAQGELSANECRAIVARRGSRVYNDLTKSP